MALQELRYYIYSNLKCNMKQFKAFVMYSVMKTRLIYNL